ncbi:hypothetical protein [Kutzneria albida]|uniref:Secreted protein n=1 Tax=Kutzneria albida DSM 43870 TaxID=1449976 RepID=W5WMR3_9PSEU|nr:hypothetical protein [Kutzneria albida]AHI01832.1 hypothetical protein KALB_8475 [Kutzneria albida DSM 43870]
MRKNLGLAATAALAGTVLSALVVPAANATEVPVTTSAAPVTTSSPVVTSSTQPVPSTTTTAPPVSTTTTVVPPTTTTKPLPPKGQDEAFVVASPDYPGLYGVAVLCWDAEPNSLGSSVLDLDYNYLKKSTAQGATVWSLAALLKPDVANGSYAFTAKCGDRPVSYTFEVTNGVAKVPTTAPVKINTGKPGQQVAVKPKGGVQTGGGFTAQG